MTTAAGNWISTEMVPHQPPPEWGKPCCRDYT